jgi:TRAP-type mannitol/chloroaromatic compound transport system permease small subunit
MILLMFILAVLFGAFCLYIGYSQASFPMAYLGMFVFLVVGLFVLSEGIALENGTQEVPLGSHNFITVYETHTTANDPIVNIIGNAFFYIPFVGVVLSTLFALRGWR